MTAPSTHSVFDSYALPLARRHGRSAAALSVVVHAAIAVLVLWRGAVLFESSSGGGRGLRGGVGREDRLAMTWVALPQISSPQAETASTPAPPITVPTVAPPRIEPVKLHVSLLVMNTALPTPLPAPAGADDGMSGATASGRPDSGGGREADGGRGAGSVAGAGSGGGASDMFAGDIFGPTPLLVAVPPAGAPPADHRKHDVQFWIRADGRVTKIAVSPPIKDSDYRRRFMEAMSDIVFSPVKTRDGRPIDYVYSIVVNP